MVAVDPVCGRQVDPASCPLRAVYGGRAFYFCSSECKDAFDRDAVRYGQRDDECVPWERSAYGGP